jgi:hypothetical protein
MEFDRTRIIDDNAGSFNGRPLSDYDLILAGGPEHNSYAKKLVQQGVLKYSKTDQKMPAVVIEARKMPNGRLVVCVGDVSGFIYDKKDLPLEGIIPEKLSPAAAVVLGSLLGFFGAFVGKIFPSLSNLWGKFWEFITGYLFTHAQEKISEKDIEMRKLSVESNKKKGIILGLSLTEILVALICAVLLGLAFLLADRIAILPGNILIYIIIAGIATVAHDMAHRIIAFIYKADSEYQFWGIGTITMFFTSWLFGTVFAQPARTIISGNEDKLTPKRKVVITLAGPIISLILSFAFLILVPFGGKIAAIGVLGFTMNLLSTIYSLMPFDPMDGKDIFGWSKLFWALIFLPLLLFYIGMLVFIL